MMRQKKKKRVPFTPEAATQIIRDHFANLTREEFIENLRRVCPELFTNGNLDPRKIYICEGDDPSLPAGAEPQPMKKPAPQDGRMVGLPR